MKVNVRLEEFFFAMEFEFVLAQFESELVSGFEGDECAVHEDEFCLC